MNGLIKTMRPKHWIKNFFVFAPLFFSGHATDMAEIIRSMYVFMAFCAMSSAVYLLNDITDRERDRLHPVKKNRPLASGKLKLHVAVTATAFLALFALTVSMWINSVVFFVLAAYALINIGYSYGLKHVVIVDVFCIAAGFVLRVVGGGAAIAVTPSTWLITATFLLSLFLALAKRRHELVLLDEKSDGHRPVLSDYSARLVDELISVVTPVTLISYLLYTLDASTIARFHAPNLYLTGAFVVFGLFRYLYLIHQKNKGGSPTDLVLQDIPLMVAIVAWVIAFGGIIYAANL